MFGKLLRQHGAGHSSVLLFELWYQRRCHFGISVGAILELKMTNSSRSREKLRLKIVVNKALISLIYPKYMGSTLIPMDYLTGESILLVRVL